MLPPRRILILGCGSVSQCTLPLLLRQLDLAPSAYTVLDMVDNRARIADELAEGVGYVIDHITRDNLDEVLSVHVSAGDILLDLAWNIDCNVIVEWCRDHGVRYLNTSVEMWDPYDDAANIHPLVARSTYGTCASAT
jgi:homospermidine synthase